MEQKYKSFSIFEFQERFPDDESCLKHLVELKWSAGYSCKKCGHKKWCKGEKPHDRQCTSCNYTESPTAGTLFHRVKFSLKKAFYITYFVGTNKKGITSTELSRKLGLRQKTCWLFKRKVMKAMQSSGKFPLEGEVEVDETLVGQQEEGKKGRQIGSKNLVVVGIEKKNKGVSRLYARVIKSASAKDLGRFFDDHISSKARIKTDKWAGYRPLKKSFPELQQIRSGKKGANFPELQRVIMNLKSWLRGVHHHVEDLQDYLNEYCYRFNRSLMKETLFDNLLNRMMISKPCPYKHISTAYHLNA